MKFTNEELEMIKEVRNMGLTGQFKGYSDEECLEISEAVDEILENDPYVAWLNGSESEELHNAFENC